MWDAVRLYWAVNEETNVIEESNSNLLVVVLLLHLLMLWLSYVWVKQLMKQLRLLILMLNSH